MAAEDLQLYQLILDALNAVGVIGLLVFLLIAFYKGYIIPKSVMKDVVVALSAELLQDIENLLESKKDTKRSGGFF